MSRGPARGVVGGLFVGGRSSRMGSDKALLMRGGERLVDRGLRVLGAVCEDVVLVGRGVPGVGCEPLPDAPGVQGPLAGLIALLEYAGPRRAVALAVDMPFVEAEHLEALLALEGSAAPRQAGHWQPLCAVYAGGTLAIAKQRAAAGRLSLQGVLDELGASEVRVPDDALRDWDTPADVCSG